MLRGRKPRVVWFLSLVFGVALPALANPANRIHQVRLSQESGQTVVEIAGDRALNFTTFKQDAPKRVVVDMAECSFTGVPRNIAGDGQLVDTISTSEVTGGPHNISRVVISLSREVEYRVTARGGSLFIYLTPGTGGLLVSAGIPMAPERSESTTALDSSKTSKNTNLSLPIGEEVKPIQLAMATQKDTTAREERSIEPIRELPSATVVEPKPTQAPEPKLTPVVESKPEPKQEPKAKAIPVVEPKPTQAPEPKLTPVVESKPEPKQEPKAKAVPVVEEKPAPVSEPKPAPAVVSKPMPEPATEPKAMPTMEPKVAPAPEAKATVVAELTSTLPPVPESKPTPVAAPTPASAPKLTPTPIAELKPAPAPVEPKPPQIREQKTVPASEPKPVRIAQLTPTPKPTPVEEVKPAYPPETKVASLVPPPPTADRKQAPAKTEEPVQEKTPLVTPTKSVSSVSKTERVKGAAAG